MELRDVKELVNVNLIAEASETCESMGDYFEEAVEIIVREFNDDVWNAERDCELDEDSLDYLEAVKRAITRELVEALRNMKYKNIRVEGNRDGN